MFSLEAGIPDISKEVTSREELSEHCLVLIHLSPSYAANVKLGTTMSPSGRMTAPLLKDFFVVSP